MGHRLNTDPAQWRLNGAWGLETAVKEVAAKGHPESPLSELPSSVLTLSTEFEDSMVQDDDWSRVFQQVLVRGLCDALGFTNLPHQKEEHRKTVNEARAWFIEQGPDFHRVCDLAGLDPCEVRRVVMALVHARSTGDHTNIPQFWRHVFRGRRSPNLTNIDRALAAVEEAA